MNQDGVEIDQDPASVLIAVNRQRTNPVLTGSFDDPVRDRLDLTVRFALEDDEVVGHRRLALERDAHRLLGELILASGLDEFRQLQGAELRLRQRFDYAGWGRR